MIHLVRYTRSEPSHRRMEETEGRGKESKARRSKEGGGKEEKGRRRAEKGKTSKRKEEAGSLLYVYSSHYIKW